MHRRIFKNFPYYLRLPRSCALFFVDFGVDSMHRPFRSKALDLSLRPDRSKSLVSTLRPDRSKSLVSNLRPGRSSSKSVDSTLKAG